MNAPHTARPTHRWRDTSLTVLGTLLMTVAAMSGIAVQALTAIVVLTLLLGLVSRLVARRRGEIVVVRSLDAPAWHKRQLLVRMAFVVAWLTTVLALGSTLMRLGASGVEWGLVTAAVALWWTALAIVQTKTIPIATNLGFALATAAIAAGWAVMLVPAPQPVELASPVDGELLVLQGGDSPILNHHYLLRSQRYALDMLVMIDGKVLAESEGDDLLTQTLGFGTELLAPAAGRVVHVVDGLPDDEGDLKQPAGNQVVIQLDEGRFVLLAHLKNGSVAVKEGDEVATGDRVGALGNSGNSTMPHLHLQVQSHPELNAEGLETFPIRFASSPGDGRVRRGDVVSPAQRQPPR